MPEHKDDMRRNADYLVQLFQRIGLHSELIETATNPLVFAEYRGNNAAKPDAPTILIYGHYDVQPPDPLELWETPPFEPTIRDGNVYARGANDDKGQSMTHIFAVEALLKTEGNLPCNVKFVLEGEEEVGSNALHDYIQTGEGKQRLACDCILVSDTNLFAPGSPTITYGVRGVMAFELELAGPNRDLHSGIYGGAVYNPAVALAKILSQIIDEDGIIQVPAFYDDVIPLTDDERKQFADLPFDETEFLDRLGVHCGHKTFGEKGYSLNERRWARPSFDINGLTSGYQSNGSKTIIPRKASAKFTFRLVPNQSPVKIRQAVESYIASLIPDGITWKIEMQHGEPAMCVDLAKSTFVKPMSEALQNVFGKPPVFIREGGSIPILAACQYQLDCDVLFVGWGQDDDAIHSPNEKFSLDSFYTGIIASATFLRNLVNKAAAF
ncbi:hypothetical protein FACS189454_04820 [Planctomycetales bacterium]|nr:hypothetical protein FACS189454_04820 [Planctomycetales bacterium]